MHLSKLLLQNFRSYPQKLIEFDPKINLILGPNGSGKTNILEAIYCLSSGKSFRATSMSKLINWQQSFASIRAKVNKNDEETEIEVRLINDVNNNNKNTISRKFLLNKVEKPRKKYLGSVRTVIFHPEDIRLVNGSPTRRREFLDQIFSQSEWRYASALSQFNKALKHRNELLDQIKCGSATKNELFYWDQSLIKNAKVVEDFRISFIRSVNNFLATHPDSEIQTININYHPSTVTQEKLDKNYQIEINKGYTQSGIHRDDFSFDNSIFPSTDKNLAFWGSRGQQRLAVLALRLAQIDYFHQTYHQAPILLLDDIFSELDPEHRQLVANVCQKYQTIFTSSEADSADVLPTAKVIQL